MESRWYLPPGKRLETTTISEREHALHVTASAWKKLTSHLDRNRIVEEALEKERLHKKALKEGSEAMTKNWTDSIERSHLRKDEERKKRAEMLEEEKLQNYNVLRQEQEDMRQAYIERVKQSMYYTKAYPRLLNSALLEAEAIYERKKQIEFDQMIKAHDMEEEKKYADRIKLDVEDDRKEKEKKKLEAWNKKQDLKAIYLKEIEERREFQRQHTEKTRKKQLMDFEYATKELELQEKMKREDLQKVKETRKQELLDYIRKDNAIKEQLRKEEVEVKEVIEIFDEAKRNIECLRKEKDIEIRNKMIEQRQAAGKMAVQEKKAKDAEYEKILKTAQEEVERKHEARKLEQLEFLKQMKKDREEDRRQFLERQEQEKIKEKELKKWELLNRQKQAEVTKEYAEEKRKKQWEKTLQYRKDLLDQIEETKQRDKEDDTVAICTKFLRDKLAEKDKKFFEYADTVIDYCKANGRPTYPIMKVVDHYKKENSIGNPPEPYCDPIDKYEERREIMANETPGKMCHYPSSDPNYKKCKCYKERIYK